MSVKVMGLVWDEPLSRDMKFVLLAYADHADHAGRNIYPAIETVAHKTGYDVRSVQRITSKLEQAGYLVLDGGARRGGQGRSTHWRIPIKDDKLSPIKKGDKKDIVKVQRVTKRALKGDTVSPDPSLTGKNEPSDHAPTPYVLNSEKMERCFSEARGCPLPDWEHDPKGSNKRWRMPLNKILKACDGNVEAACYFIAEITREFRKDNLTFTAPDQILESVTSRIIDRKSRQVIYAEEH